jgi:hypothetical protein
MTTQTPDPTPTASPRPAANLRSSAPFVRPPRPGALRRLAARLRTAGRLVLHFLHPARFILAPLLIVLLLAGILLSLTGGLAYVAPFVYTLF